MALTALDLTLQAAGPGGGATFTLGFWGIVALVTIAAAVAGAVAGWIFHLLTRREADIAGPRGGAGPAEAPPVPVVAGSSPAAGADPLENLFDRAAAAAPDGVLLVRGGLIARISSPGGLLGAQGRTLQGRAFLDVVHTTDLLAVAEALRGGAEGRRPLRRLEFMLAHGSDGPPRHVSARLLAMENGEGGDFVAVLSDVTSSMALANAAAAAARRLTSALERVPSAVLLTAFGELGESVALANRAAAELLAVPPAELAGMPLALLRSRIGARFTAGIALSLFPEPGVEDERRVEVDGEGPRRLVRTVRSLSESDPMRGRLFILRDATAAAAREEELARGVKEARRAWEALDERQEEILLANEGLEKRIADFARFNRELKLIDEMKSNFLANVSHELQTPLVAIKGYTEMILKGRLGPLTDEQEKGLNVALRNADRLIGLIDSLLSFVRTEKDSEPMKVEVFPLRVMVEEVVELLGERALEKNVRLKILFPSGDLAVRADRNRIAQVFINLVTNAIKYNRHNGVVEIEAAKGSRSSARVEVRDTGEGIPREDLDRIFERFYRAPSAGGEGSGLGLAIARDILRLHGCQIRADSEAGKGSKFSFTLPLEARGRLERAPRLAGTEKDEG
jgi:signal transduction histidine kinase